VKFTKIYIQWKPLNRAPSGIATCSNKQLFLYPMRTFCNKNRVSFTAEVHQYSYQYQGTVFYSRCEHCTHTVLQKEKLLYFCKIFIIMYCTVAVAVDTVHSCPSSAQKNWLIFCFTSFLH